MRKFTFVFTLLIMSLMFAACQPAAVPAAGEEPTVAPTAEPTAVPTAVPTEEPDAAPVEEAEQTPILELVGPSGSQFFTMADLEKLPVSQGMAGMKSSTGKITAPMLFTGISLKDLAEAAGGIDESMGINLVASDGYSISYSYDQIMNGTYIAYDPATGDELRNPVELDAILAYKQDGEPLDSVRDGNLRLAIISEEGNQVTDGHWAVKWVEKVEVRSTVQDWVLSLKGAIEGEIDRASYELCVGCHPAVWTDDLGQEWQGTELWRLMGYADDAVKHEGYSYDVKLAKSGYDVKLIASDGYEVVLNSDDADRNHEWVVAMLVDGVSLDEKNFPLKLVGTDLTKKEMVGAISRIELGVPPIAAGEPEPEATPEPAAAPAVDLEGAEFAIVGLVNTETGFTEDTLRALDVVTINAEHPKNGPQDFEGVLLSELFEMAGIQSGATTLVITAADGFSAEVSLADVQACPNCMLGFTNTAGKFKMVMPDLPSNTWVKDVVKIEVK